MNFRRLKYFVKIVDIGSLTQAAEVLHIAQPALSQQVATLEGELDQQLLIRTKRGVTPTEAGKILYSHARTILRQCEQAQLAVNNAGQNLSGQVSIGLAPGTAASSMPRPTKPPREHPPLSPSRIDAPQRFDLILFLLCSINGSQAAKEFPRWKTPVLQFPSRPSRLPTRGRWRSRTRRCCHGRCSRIGGL